MPGTRHVVFEFGLIAPITLLMLTLFDSNAWWRSLLFALLATVANLALAYGLRRTPLPRTARAFGRGIGDALLAFLLGLTPFLRTTFGTLVGFSLLLGLVGLVTDDPWRLKE